LADVSAYDHVSLPGHAPRAMRCHAPCAAMRHAARRTNCPRTRAPDRGCTPPTERGAIVRGSWWTCQCTVRAPHHVSCRPCDSAHMRTRVGAQAGTRAHAGCMDARGGSWARRRAGGHADRASMIGIGGSSRAKEGKAHQGAGMAQARGAAIASNAARMDAPLDQTGRIGERARFLHDRAPGAAPMHRRPHACRFIKMPRPTRLHSTHGVVHYAAHASAARAN